MPNEHDIKLNSILSNIDKSIFYGLDILNDILNICSDNQIIIQQTERSYSHEHVCIVCTCACK